METKTWLQRHQIAVYAVAVAFAVSLGVGRPSTASSFERLINPVLAVLL